MTLDAPPVDRPPVDPAAVAALADDLRSRGVVGVQLGWVDLDGVVRSRLVPTAGLSLTARRGVAVPPDVFGDLTHSRPVPGDPRLIPALRGPEFLEHDVVQLNGDGSLAWVAARVVAADGAPWPSDPRTILEDELALVSETGFATAVGFELEFSLTGETGERESGADQDGMGSSARGLGDASDFVVTLLVDLEANGVVVEHLHAGRGAGRFELALAPLDALAAVDASVLARRTVHAAARAHSLRATFAPGSDNASHLHLSLGRDGANAFSGDDDLGLSPVGRAFLAGVVHDLPGLTAITAPSGGSLLRLRPGRRAGARAGWSVSDREAAVRLVPMTPLLGHDHTHLELRACDTSANPFLAVAVLLAAGMRGISEGHALPAPLASAADLPDPGTPAPAPGVVGMVGGAVAAGALLAVDHDDRRTHLHASSLVREVLGPDLFGAFNAARDAQAARPASMPLI